MVIRDPFKARDPNLEGCKYNVLVEWETGDKTYEPTSVLTADDPDTYTSHAKESDLSNIDGWERFKNLAKRDKHDHSYIDSPKGEMKSLFSGVAFSRAPFQAL